MKINRDIVNSLASLARLNLLPTEESIFVAQLPKILDYVGQLQNVKTEILTEVSTASAGWRDDRVEEFAPAEEILKQAPERTDHFWRVPSVF